MKKIVIDKNNLIIVTGTNIYYDNYNNESLIKIITGESDDSFYYIRNNESNNYKIIETQSLPLDYQPFKYFYNDGDFILNENYSE